MTILLRRPLPYETDSMLREGEKQLAAQHMASGENDVGEFGTIQKTGKLYRR